ncbi:sodium/potassium/calcium exchanger 1-like isoform X2 [Entelurus aequoreus]|uniref:sodium/potassium/calcium exchanger 1-like isoform X2 n=1 Tax=Entelurus aequoreus TaxID=161455 RepID=UPI002B1D2DCA|nr:sodium/potassium/calcium exchanger 1-like isoform X2 [Entelurus aequoreus]
MHCLRRKRLQLRRVLFLLTGVFMCVLYQLTISARRYETLPLPQFRDAFAEGSAAWVEDVAGESREKSSMVQSEVKNQTTPEPHTVTTSANTTDKAETPPGATTNRTIVHCIFVPPDPKVEPPNTPSAPTDAPHVKGEYPKDLFSVEERRQGWVVLHILGMVYMFVSLAIVCDEFFVPALGVIIDKLAISDDVAGATFMAAGGSAPELFTSFIGVFIAHSNVGIGTIVGSAVFNILFVIGMCALFSREVLCLTWWPLFRDVSFYILDLILLIIFFLDNVIMWWESMALVASYTLYVIFMKFNAQIEHLFKTQLYKHKNIVRIITEEEPKAGVGFYAACCEICSPGMQTDHSGHGVQTNGDGEEKSPPPPEDKNWLKLKPALQRGGSSASLHNSTMRNTIFQLMIHTLDPLGEGKFKDKAQSLNNVVRRKTLDKMSSTSEDEDEDGEEDKQQQDKETKAAPESEKKENPEDKKEDQPAAEEDSAEDSDEDSDDSSEDENEEEPLSLEWPESPRKQITYLILLPIVFPLWLTVPDVRKQTSRNYFAATFLGSILWIGIFSYLMVWWAHQVGETIGISEEIMGLTILAAGTSIPDLITSVIVARKGLGDMAVSSSVGSNIFDITVGLPVPWLLYSAIHGLVPVAVSSNGLFCAIVLLFLMLLFVIISIACCKWKMNKGLGFTMFLLYFIFLVLSVMLEDRVIICPVSI